MLIIVLLGLGVTLAVLEQPVPLGLEPPAWLAGPAVAVYLLAAAAVTAANTASTVRAVGYPDALAAARAVRRHRMLGAFNYAWLIAGSAAVMSAGYKDLIVERLRLADLPLAAALVAWAPFAAALLITWALDYPFYRAMRLRTVAAGPAAQPAAAAVWSRGEFLLFNARHYLLMVAVPVGMIVLASDSIRLYLCPLLPSPADAAAMVLGSLVSAAVVFLVSPAVIVRIWRTSPLPAGQLRQELEWLCRQMKLRYRDILIWHSGGAIANAAVMGLTGRIRYILISDGLLANLDSSAVKAIFAHEAGHIRHHHILHSVVFAVASAALCAAAVEPLAAVMGWGDEMAQAVFLLLLATVWAAGFGWVSRRFEWQSDAMAAYLAARQWANPSPADGPEQPAPADGRITLNGAMVFAYALHRVAQLNGIPANQRNWRHGSIAARIARVMYLGETAAPIARVNRATRRVKLLLWLALAAAVAANVIQVLLAPPLAGA